MDIAPTVCEAWRIHSPCLALVLPGSFTIGACRIKAAQLPDTRPDKWRALSKVTIPHSRDHSPEESQPGI